MALTFAYPLTAHPFAGGEGLRRNPVVHEYNPFDIKHMEDTLDWQKQLEAAG